ncbi:hypothetical protein D3C75_1114610 [compost metagenome]
MALMISWRSSGEMSITWQPWGRSVRACGSMNRVRMRTAPAIFRSCSTAAGTHTPRPGGTTQLPCSELTVMTPLKAWINCARLWQWAAMRSPWR